MVITAHQNVVGMFSNRVPSSSCSQKKRRLEKMMIPITKNKMSNNNSRMDARRVCPNICSPIECFDNLMIRKTRMTRILCRNGTVVSSTQIFTKNGTLANKSIQFKTTFIKAILLRQNVKRTMSSTVKYATHMASRTSRVVLYFFNDLIVSIQNRMTDSVMSPMLR